MKRARKIALISAVLLIVLAGLIWSVYNSYFYINQCSNVECFSKAMVDCKRKSYISDTADTIMEYSILGKDDGKCAVNTKLMRVKQGGSELKILEGKEMKCYVPLGVYTAPEKDLKNCHGLLKEEIQELIIKRMHTQIVENLGKISEETTKIL